MPGYNWMCMNHDHCGDQVSAGTENWNSLEKMGALSFRAAGPGHLPNTVNAGGSEPLRMLWRLVPAKNEGE